MGAVLFQASFQLTGIKNSLICRTDFLSYLLRSDIYSSTLYAKLLSWLTFTVAFKQGLADWPVHDKMLLASAINFQLEARFFTRLRSV